jgi:hypothetical protein
LANIASFKFTLLVKHGSSEMYHGIKSGDISCIHTHIYIEQCIYASYIREALKDDERKVALFSNSQVRVVENSNF